MDSGNVIQPVCGVCVQCLLSCAPVCVCVSVGMTLKTGQQQQEEASAEGSQAAPPTSSLLILPSIDPSLAFPISNQAHRITRVAQQSIPYSCLFTSKTHTLCVVTKYTVLWIEYFLVAHESKLV